MRSVFNNGYVESEDHVMLYYTYRDPGQSGPATAKKCIHQGQQTNIVVPGGGPVTVTRIDWVSRWTKGCDV